MAPPHRALIAVTSAQALLPDGHTTGVFIGEALHPYNVFKAAGYEVDIVSEEGKWTADWLSLQPGFLTEEERKQYDDLNSDFRSELERRKKAADVDASKVCTVHISLSLLFFFFSSLFSSFFLNDGDALVG